MENKKFSMKCFRKNVRVIVTCVDLVDSANGILSSLTNKGLTDPEMFCRSVVHLVGTLEKHPMIISVDVDRVPRI